MKYPREWEDITDEKYAGCSRLKVPGGWLVVSWVNATEQENILFVSDPKHEWELVDSKD